MNVWKNLWKRMQDPQQRASVFTVATLVLLFLLPGIGWYLVCALWIINAIWSFRQTSDRGVRIIHGVIGAVLALWMLFSLGAGAMNLWAQ